MRQPRNAQDAVHLQRNLERATPENKRMRWLVSSLGEDLGMKIFKVEKEHGFDPKWMYPHPNVSPLHRGQEEAPAPRRRARKSESEE